MPDKEGWPSTAEERRVWDLETEISKLNGAVALLKRVERTLCHENIGGDSIFGDGHHVDKKCLKCVVRKYLGLKD